MLIVVLRSFDLYSYVPCTSPQLSCLEINQQRCARLFPGAVSLLRPPVDHKMVRPAVSLLNYCISGHGEYKLFT